MAHIIPPKTYYQVFAALMVLLVLTVAAAQIEHRLLNTVSAITIAVTKAALIVMFFMHVKYSSRMTQVLAVAGFIWLAILIVIVAADYQSRSWPAVSLQRQDELLDEIAPNSYSRPAAASSAAATWAPPTNSANSSPKMPPLIKAART